MRGSITCITALMGQESEWQLPAVQDGSFVDIGSVMPADGDSIDPAVFLDDDGSVYYYWGQLYLRGAKLKPDMKTKVLGFYDREVHLYTNKETLILTVMGILLGLPAGYALIKLLISMLNLPAIQFVVHAEPISYLIAAVISFSFAVTVNQITNRILDHVNMVEALKSVE